MGIQGLLPTLKSIMNPRHIRDYAGKRVAIDTYSWLHKAAFSCSKELCLGLPNDKYIDYCMHRVNMLRHFGLQPVLVFDGGGLPMKSDQEVKRARSRKENLERALEHERLGNLTAAMQCYQRAVDITPAIAFRLIKVLRHENVDYVVAPYEADAQMAFLARNGHVDLVITEDSDLIAYGCPQIFFKMDKYGQGVGFQFSDITASKDIDFNNFSRQMILEMCIMSGCDYLPSLPGMGVKKAHGLMKRFKTYQKVMKHLKFSGVLIDEQYEQGFRRAILTFQHHRVYDPAKRAMVHLTDVPGELLSDLNFLGPCVSPAVAIAIARGEVDPTTYDPFEEMSSSGTLSAVVKEKVRVGSPNVFVEVSTQKNALITNFFQGADVAPKKQFIPPRSASDYTSDNSSLRLSTSQEEIASQVTSSPTSLSQSYSSPFSKFSFASQQSPVFGTPPSQVSPFVSEELDLDAELPIINTPASNYSPSDFLLRTRSFSEEKPKLQIPSPFAVDSLIRSRSVERKTFVSPHNSQNASTAKVRAEATFTTVTAKRSAYFSRPASLQSPPTSPGTIQIQRNAELLAKFEDSQRSTSTCTSEGGEIADHRDYVNDVVDCADLDQKQEVLKDITNIEQPDSVAAGKRKHLPHFQSDLLGERPMKSRSLPCVSHVGQYASLAQRSMDDFVSTIAPFRFSQTGSRASGLRAPLKQGSRASGLRAPPKSARKSSTSRASTTPGSTRKIGDCTKTSSVNMRSLNVSTTDSVAAGTVRWQVYNEEEWEKA